MSDEAAFIALMRGLATHPGARDLMDDAAVLDRPAGPLVITHDMLVEGVHFLPDDPADTVAWKLCAVNMSDLAAKGATPLGILIGYGMTGDASWDAGFARGLQQALDHFHVSLLGGDTVRMPENGPHTLGMTAIGTAPDCAIPDRRGAQAGDMLFVTGTIGDAGAGLNLLKGQLAASETDRETLITAYRQPRPPVTFGPAIAPLVSAMADISDGLLIDAQRIARASGLMARIDLALTPLSPAYGATCGNDAQSRLAAATAGDDYQLIFTAAPQHEAALHSIATQTGIALSAIGHMVAAKDETALTLTHDGTSLALPARLGYLHGDAPTS